MRLQFELMETLKIALSAIIANKVRGALTTLGIIIGIVAVSTTMTAANGLKNTFKESFSSVGTGVIYVSQMPWVVIDNFFDFRNRPKINVREVDELERRLEGRALVNPSFSTNRNIRHKAAMLDGVNVVGTTERYIDFSGSMPEEGRFILAADVTYKTRVAVLGSVVAESLFGNSDPLDNTILVGTEKYRVIGVMEEQGGGFLGGPNLDRQIFIPVGAFIKSFGSDPNRYNIDIAVKTLDISRLEDLEYEVTGEMRKIRKLRPLEGDDFSINKLESLVNAFNNIMGVVLIMGLVITGISLFVGGIGVMNIMFVSVTERTREIGIRKAIGATRRSVLVQFLFEAAIICLFGGMMGIALSALITAGINAALMPAQLSIPIAVIAMVISVITGVLAGIIPAWRGANLDPIAALRFE